MFICRNGNAEARAPAAAPGADLDPSPDSRLDLSQVVESYMSLGVPIYEMAKWCESPGDSAVHIPGVPGTNSTHPAFSLAGTASENGDIRMHEEFSFRSSISKNNCCPISLATSEPVEGQLLLLPWLLMIWA